MYVRPERRGQGVAGHVLDLLEGEAAIRGCTRLLLETGPFQHGALALYARRGYQVRGSYGDYPDDPNSVFMGKPLGKTPSM